MITKSEELDEFTFIDVSGTSITVRIKADNDKRYKFTWDIPTDVLTENTIINWIKNDVEYLLTITGDDGISTVYQEITLCPNPFVSLWLNNAFVKACDIEIINGSIVF